MPYIVNFNENDIILGQCLLNIMGNYGYKNFAKQIFDSILYDYTIFGKISLDEYTELLYGLSRSFR